MSAQFEQIRALRLDLVRLRRRAASLRAIAAGKRRQSNLNNWAQAAVRRSDATRRARDADRRARDSDRRVRAAYARRTARIGGQPDPDERQRLADLRELEADERDHLADLREQRVKERERLADERDHLANQRDLEADRRDLLADKRDAAADLRDQLAFSYYLRSFRLGRELIEPPVPLAVAAEGQSRAMLPAAWNGLEVASTPDDADSTAGFGTSGEVVQLRPEHRRRVDSPGPS